MKNELALCLATFVGVSISSLPASADNNNPMVDRSNLPLARHHVSPKQIQIINEEPIVTNCVRPAEQPRTYKFIGTGNAGTIHGGAPQLLDGARIGNPTVNTSNPMVDTSGMDTARFGTNIPAGGSGLSNRNLPKGTASTVLSGRMFAPPAAASAPRFSAGSPRTMTAPATTRPATAAVYPQSPAGSGSSAAGTHSSTAVSAELWKNHLSKKTGH